MKHTGGGRARQPRMSRKAWRIAFVCLGGVLFAQRHAAPISEVVICETDSDRCKAAYSSEKPVEAPVWSANGQELIWSSEGRLWRFGLGHNAPPQPIPTGALTRLNRHHAISPDGSRIAFSEGELFVVPFEGGQPQRLSFRAPLFVYAWSPDGKQLAYAAKRHNNADIYTIRLDSGEETRRTESLGFDDCPDFSPDGQFLYFTSDRAGSWDIWRMSASVPANADRVAERLTSDEREDWFPHPSPDGRRLLFLSYKQGTTGHPANEEAQIRQMRLDLPKRPVTTLQTFVGGQGSMDMNPWSRDGKKFVFVRRREKSQGTQRLVPR